MRSFLLFPRSDRCGNVAFVMPLAAADERARITASADKSLGAGHGFKAVDLLSKCNEIARTYGTLVQALTAAGLTETLSGTGTLHRVRAYRSGICRGRRSR